MSGLTDILLAPDVRPFAVAAAIMLALSFVMLLVINVAQGWTRRGLDHG